MTEVITFAYFERPEGIKTLTKVSSAIIPGKVQLILHRSCSTQSGEGGMQPLIDNINIHSWTRPVESQQGRAAQTNFLFALPSLRRSASRTESENRRHR